MKSKKLLSLLLALATVSYTHLDVYKRQGMGHHGPGGHQRLEVAEAGGLTVDGVGPDVYKRQVQQHLLGFGGEDDVRSDLPADVLEQQQNVLAPAAQGRDLHQHGVEPVSYTHLDVYKRQGIGGAHADDVGTAAQLLQGDLDGEVLLGLDHFALGIEVVDQQPPAGVLLLQ